MDNLKQTLKATVATIHRHVPERLRFPTIGIVCGSGLNTLATQLRDAVEVPYELLEGFATTKGALSPHPAIKYG